MAHRQGGQTSETGDRSESAAHLGADEGDDAGEPGRGVPDTAAMNLVLLRLIGLYAGLSVLAFGGGNGVIPAARRRPSAHWLSTGDFLDIFAIPAPRRAGVADRGESRWHGAAGGAAVLAAIFAPSRLACMWSPRYWERPSGSLGGWCWSALWPDRNCQSALACFLFR